MHDRLLGRFAQMTTLADTEACVVNRHVTAQIASDKITMLYEVKDGPCLQSFGIHVAAMAGQLQYSEHA